MLTLGYLQSLGVLPGDYQSVVSKYTTCISEFLKNGNKEPEKGPVVVDGCVWIATRNRMPAVKADTVYSCNGEQIGCWKRSELSFFFQELAGNLLITKKVIKGGNLMSAVDVNQGLEDMLNGVGQEEIFDGEQSTPVGMNLDELSKELESIGGESSGDAQRIDAFESHEAESDANGTDSAISEEVKLRREAKEAEKKAVYQEITRVAGKGVTLNEAAILTNLQKGRLIGFIVKTPEVIKPSLKKKPVEGPNGKRILNQLGQRDANIVKKFNDGKSVAAKYLEREASWVLQQSKPGKIVGMIIKTPTNTEMSVLSDDTGKVTKIDAADTTSDFQIKILESEAAYAYLAVNYEDAIKEDESVLGADKATTLQIFRAYTQPRDSTGEAERPKVKTVLKLQKHEGVRETLLTDGNFFPMETYETASISTTDTAVKRLLNNNFAACVASYKKKMGSEDAPALGAGQLVLDGADGEKALVVAKSGTVQGSFESLTSEWVDGNKVPDIAKYDSKTVKIQDVRLPLREEATTKTGTAIYRYKKVKMDDVDNEHCALKDARYARLIKATGLSPEVFAKRVSAINAKAPSRSSGKNYSISAGEYLAWKANSEFADGTKSFAALQREIQGLAL